MTIPNKVRTFLAERRGDFKARKAENTVTLDEAIDATGLKRGEVARATVLKSGKAYLMVVVPADREPDLEKIGKLFKRSFEPCGREELARLFPDCDIDFLPPFGSAFDLKTIQDRTLAEQEAIYFATGGAGLLVRATRDDYARLQAEAWTQHTIAQRPVATGGEPDLQRDTIRNQVEAVESLPPMPGIAAEIIRLRNNPYSHASELAAVIDQDPSLAAQLIRYATSPLYGYQGKVDSVQQAIVRVLGMDFVYDLAFGLALGRNFRNPKGGPIGLDAFWDHAVQCAALSQALCGAIDFARRPVPGTAYLAGLLHNFGFLLLGHLFPEQFAHLNQAIAEQPDRSVLEIERETIGVTHTELGLWLMDSWDMPREVVEAVREHHNPHHHSDFSDYANLVYVANALLKRYGIGDAESTEIPAPMLTRMGLDMVRVEMVLATVMEDREGLEFIACKMAA